MTDQDRRAGIKARRAAVPDPPYEVEDTVTEEEFYMRWRLLRYGPADEYGWRDWWAAMPASRADHAEFIANAPADIDWLVGEVERCERDYDDLQEGFAGKVNEVDRLRGLLARLEWNRDGLCNGCNGLRYPSGSFPLGHEEGCWVAAALPQTQNDAPPSS